jgi:hypothetical protein
MIQHIFNHMFKLEKLKISHYNHKTNFIQLFGIFLIREYHAISKSYFIRVENGTQQKEKKRDEMVATTYGEEVVTTYDEHKQKATRHNDRTY